MRKRASRIYPLLLSCLETVEKGGVGAATIEPSARTGGVMRGGAAVDYATAMRLIKAFLDLPKGWKLAVRMLAVGGVRTVDRFVAEMVPEIERELGEEAKRWGRFGVEYFVWYWVQQNVPLPIPPGAGRSFREFAEIAGVSHVTARSYYMQTVEKCLDGWCTAAEGELEPVCLRLFPLVRSSDLLT